MATIVKPIYTQELIWGVEGAKTLPPTSKVKGGWVQEMMPAEYENWIQNRQDQAIAYLFQFGIPEWDSLTEYIANKSFVQADGRIYLAKTTNTNVEPSLTGIGANTWTLLIGSDLLYAAITGKTGGIVLPSGTTNQRPVGLNTPALRYNSTLSALEMWNGSVWVIVQTPSAAKDQHKAFTLGDIHGIANWSVANTIALNSIVVTGSDLHKIAYVSSTQTYYSLIQVSPKSWKLIVPSIVYEGNVATELKALNNQLTATKNSNAQSIATLTSQLKTMKVVSRQLPNGIPMDGQEWIVV